MPEADTQIGTVTIAHGEARAEGVDGARVLTQGSPIYVDDVISTGAKSAVEISFQDGALLSQGPNSKVHLDEYVFDPDQQAGEMVVKMVQGTFRSVTGQIVDLNPEGFSLESPLATIGIRGTTTAHEIGPQEAHVVLEYDGKPVMVQPVAGGPVQVITRTGGMVMATPIGLGPVVQASPQDLARFQQLSSQALQQGVPDFEEDEQDQQEDEGQEGKGEGEGEGEGGEEGEGEGDEEGEGEGEGEEDEEGEQQGGPLGEEEELEQPGQQELEQPGQQEQEQPGQPGQTGQLPSGVPVMSNPLQMPMPFDVTQTFFSHPTPPLPPAPEPQPPVQDPQAQPPQPPPEPEDDDDDDDQGTDPGQQERTSLNLNEVFEGPLTVNLEASPSYYEKTGDQETRETFEDTVWKVTGQESYENTMTGNASANEFIGGTQSDDLMGLGGNDTLRAGNGGDDVVDGGEGNDLLDFGQSLTSADSVNGGTGTDTLQFTDNGSASSDLNGVSNVETVVLGAAVTTVVTLDSLVASGQTLTVNGASATSLNWDGSAELDGSFDITGSSGQDDITGGKLADTLDGGASDDVLDGGEGNDELFGGAGTDILYGGAGNDTMDGGTGDDELLGEAGDDLLKAGAGTDVYNGGADVDTLDYSGMTNGFSVNLQTGEATDGTSLHELISIESVIGTDKDDVFSGADDAANGLYGGKGDDMFSMSSYLNDQDTLDGGAGTDSLSYEDNGTGDNELDHVTNIEAIYLADAATHVTTVDSLVASGKTLTVNGAMLTEVNGLSWDGSAELDGKFAVTGGSGKDLIIGGSGNDSLDGGAGNDTVSGGRGNDSMTGGEGTDTACYAAADNGVVVNLGTGIASDGAGGTDTLSGFEAVTGSGHDDSLIGDGNTNWLEGGAGNDTLNGGTSTHNWAVYRNAASGVTADLHLDEAQDGEGGTDILINIDRVEGSAHQDYLTGDSGNNDFDGRAGDDLIDGGDGSDRVRYTHATSGVEVNLSDGYATDGEGGTDTLTSIEKAVGSGFADVFHGAADQWNAFVGMAGNDTIDGGSTDGSIQNLAGYYYDPTGVHVDLTGADFGGSYQAVDGWGDHDELVNIAAVDGSDHDDTLKGDAEDNRFDGGAGDDSIWGGAGRDTLSYYDAETGVNVDLSQNTASDGQGGTDAVYQMEDVEGTQYDDSITGDSGSNYFEGQGGNDTLDGGDNDIDNRELDVASYWKSGADGVNANLQAGTVVHGSYTDSISDIEGIQGTTGNDTFLGDSGKVNIFIDRGGSDQIDGGSAYDDVSDIGWDVVSYQFSETGIVANLADGSGTVTVDGQTDTLSNIDEIIGSDHDDQFTGGTGDQEFMPGLGYDTVDGGDDWDSVSYWMVEGVDLTVTWNQDHWEVSGTDILDTLTNVERIEGSDGNDSMVGNNDESDDFSGWIGNDTMEGGGGDDHVGYESSTAGVNVNLAGGTADDGMGGTDTLISIEDVTGSDHDDIIVGDASDNFIDGGLGSDNLDGGSGSTGEMDILGFHSARAGVNADLTQSTVDMGSDGVDTFSNFEGLSGSMFDDTLTGDSGDNSLEGRAGDDTLNGGAGTDAALYVNAESGVVADLASGTASDGEGGTDSLSSIEVLMGSEFADDFRGDENDNFLAGLDGNDTLKGRAGNDTLMGGDGTDFASYADATSGIEADLTLGYDQVYNDGYGTNSKDNLQEMEGLIGSNHADMVITSNAFTSINTGGDNDYITFGDTLVGAMSLDGGSGTEDALDAGMDGSVDARAMTSLTGIEKLYIGEGAYVWFTDTIMDGQTLEINGAISASSETLKIDFDAAGGSMDLSGLTFLDWTSGVDKVEIFGGGGDDSLVGSSWCELISETGGNDTLFGAAGNDTFDMGTSLTLDDRIDGGDGYDYVHVEGSNAVTDLNGVTYVEKIELGDVATSFVLADSIVADGETLRLYAVGTTQAMTLDGQENDGNYIMDAGSGISTFKGGAGNDTFNFGEELDNSDTVNGRDGTDVLTFIYTTSSNSSLLDGVTNVEMITIAPDMENMTSVDITTQDSLVADGETLVVDASGLVSDTSFSWDGSLENDGHFAITGGEGSDEIIGGAGNDSLMGAADNDILTGNAGNDKLFGGEGQDNISTGTGSDRVYYSATTEGGDTVTDFSHANDSFEFSSSVFGYTNATWDSSHFFTYSQDITGTNCFIWEAGTLSFDADGLGGEAAVTIASVTMEDGDLDYTDITFA
ncbi:FecR domain-containing protein [Pseudodesulfovibrio tunisiensis]|uniref:FecR domain-containing protein n=1 Tax=Pseudodesulfovibrio tunisiensis TaxID=463192 RepID=UPI0024368F01|nr:FecR domain-containing protein [Pseudodesulfovibrio tunisiensis]